jgi:hypothetical protein
MSSIPFDSTYYRSSLPIPQGSVVLKAEVVFESDMGVTGAPDYRQAIAPGGDGKLTIRTQLADNDK